jgi:hypothetical protein
VSGHTIKKKLRKVQNIPEKHIEKPQNAVNFCLEAYKRLQYRINQGEISESG